MERAEQRASVGPKKIAIECEDLGQLVGGKVGVACHELPPGGSSQNPALNFVFPHEPHLFIERLAKRRSVQLERLNATLIQILNGSLQKLGADSAIPVLGI